MYKFRVSFKNSRHQDIECKYISDINGMTYFTINPLKEAIELYSGDLVYSRRTSDIESIVRYTKKDSNPKATQYVDYVTMIESMASRQTLKDYNSKQDNLMWEMTISIDGGRKSGKTKAAAELLRKHGGTLVAFKSEMAHDLRKTYPDIDVIDESFLKNRYVPTTSSRKFLVIDEFYAHRKTTFCEVYKFAESYGYEHVVFIGNSNIPGYKDFNLRIEK